MLYNTKWDLPATTTNPYLPAAALGLAPQERAALIRVLALFETAPETLTFDMSIYYHSCGTPACMAGYADHIGRLGWFNNKHKGGSSSERFNDVTTNVQANNLFCPQGIGPWPAIPPAAAARALRAYLTTGAPDWSAQP